MGLTCRDGFTLLRTNIASQEAGLVRYLSYLYRLGRHCEFRLPSQAVQLARPSIEHG